MIKRYNIKQVVLAILAMAIGLFCSWLTFLFFRFAPAFVAAQFGYRFAPATACALGFFGLAVAFVSGYRTWKSGGGLYGYHESALYHHLGGTSGGVVVDFYAHRVTGLAYLLSQIILAGPLSLLRAATLLKSLLPMSRDMEERLVSTLDTIRSAHKWQSLDEYPEHQSEVLYLAQMGLIDFSAFKGTPRFKIR